MAAIAASAMDEAHALYDREGFVLTPQLIPGELVQRVIPRMYAVIDKEYETGVEPHARHFPDDAPPEQLRKIDDAHVSDRTIHEVISHPALGQWAAAVTGAEWVQVWATQLLVKPPAPGATSAAGNVGWHQDKTYWAYWDGEAFTAWIAISGVTEAAGAMRFVRGSHRWGFLGAGDFSGRDLDAERADIPVPDGARWEEAAAVLRPGAVSFHHRHTYHASGPNLSGAPRMSFAVHMRTEKSRPIAESYYTSHLDDPRYRPVIFEANG